jgi:hypothetical protein
MMESANNHPRVDSFSSSSSSSETFDYENEDDDEDEGKTRGFVSPYSTTGVGL